MTIRTMLLRGGRAALAYCVPTARNVRGPFYRPGAPFREYLAEPDEHGERLAILGAVVDLPNCRPVEGAVLDVWQTNARGLYSNMLGLSDPADPQSFRLRGKFRTSSEGTYQIDTILPGRYPLGLLARARHIHLIVTHPEFAMLITQIFFEGDSHVRWDPWAKQELVIALTDDIDASGRKRLRGRFDITLHQVPDGIGITRPGQG